MTTHSLTSLDPGSGWTIEQDNILISAYIDEKMNFNELKRKLPSKTQEQCKARWTFYMQQTGNKGAWTRHEDQILHVCQKEFGNRWKSIKKFLPGRSENAVKNRWNAILRKNTPSPERANGSRSGSPDGAFYTSGPLQGQRRPPQNINSADMNLRLSPGAFGMAADSPAANAGWGVNTNNNSPFNFFPGSPQQTPQKNSFSPMRVGNGGGGGLRQETQQRQHEQRVRQQQQQQQRRPQSSGGGNNGGGQMNNSGGGNNNNTPMALKVDTSAPLGSMWGPGNGLRRGTGADSRGSGKSLDESTSSMSREDMSELAEAFVAQEVEKFRKQHGETMSAEDQVCVCVCVCGRERIALALNHTEMPV